MRGVITKGIGGLYTVMADGAYYECSVRGKFRKKDMPTPIVGDNVELVYINDDVYAVDEIYKRKNMLIRPNVANVDKLVIAFSPMKPKPELYLVDKLTAAAAKEGIEVVICITKSDLGNAEPYKKIYSDVGYKTVVTGFGSDEGINELYSLTEGCITAFAGCSGVGKSTLINKISGGELLSTGCVSKKTERGRHTTRHVELIALENGGYVLDTPGFSSYEFESESRASDFFPEMKRCGECRFSDCRHINEPDCAVLSALNEGEIAQSRYDSYIRILNSQKEKYK